MSAARGVCTTCCAIACIAIGAAQFNAVAEGNETARVTDGAGLWSSNQCNVAVSAVGQAVEVGHTANPSYLNYSGFLQTFVMYPQLDNDGDSVPDENDPDDDNDGLADDKELSGELFSPMTATDIFLADSDGDHSPDRDEFVAGTNPRDAASRFVIESVRLAGESVILTWSSREAHSYEVVWSSTVTGLSVNPVLFGTVVAGTGTGVWQEVESSYSNTAPAEQAFMRVRVKQ